MNHSKFLLSVLFFLFFIGSSRLMAQNQAPMDWNHYKESAIAFGYNYSFAEPNFQGYHLPEITFVRSRYGGRHPGFAQVYAGTEMGLNTNKFLLGPKIGAAMNYAFFTLGSEIVYYTDFDQGALRFVPYFGIGFHQLHFSIRPHVRIFNRDFEPINRGQFNVTLKLIRLSRKKILQHDQSSE